MPRERKITNDALALIQSEKDKGAKWRELGEKYGMMFGLAPNSIKILCCELRKGRRTSDTHNSSQMRVRAEREELAESLAMRGNSIKVIADRLGVSRPYACIILDQLGIDSAQRRIAVRARKIRKEIIEKKKELLNIPQIFI